MRPVTVRTEDLKNIIINLGFVGENEHRQIRFDAKKDFEEYPNASASLTVVPPEGESYPAIIERDGDYVLWTITDSDVIGEGDGEIQLAFTEGEVVKRTCIGRTKTDRSLVPTGSIPSGLDDYITRADQLLDEVKDTFPAGGTTGQVLAKKSDTDYDTEWVDQGGGTEDYDELENRPQIGGVTLTGNKTLHELGAASEADVAAKYTKPATGIPASDLAAGVIQDPEDLIDDEAGAGDTDKVWSADKSHELLTEINSKADKTVTDALQKDKAPVIIDSAEGNPIVLTDGADGLPVEGMKIHFSPVQSGTGDPSPSNVRPISGWTGLTAQRTGVNLWDGEIETGFYSTTTGLPVDASGYKRCKNRMVIKPGESVYVATAGLRLLYYDAEDNYISVTTGNGVKTVPSNCHYLRFYLSDSDYTGNVSINYPSTVTESLQPLGTSYPVTFPDGETIYGGTLDAVNGVLTVDTEFVSFRWGDVNGISVGDYTRKMATGRLANYPNHKYTPVCNVAKYKAQFSEDSLHFYVNNAGKNNVIVFLPNDADEDTIVQVAYPLATPIEITLDPITIQTLLGDNTIWSDANGTIELDYRADTKLWISGHSITVDSALSDTSENPVQNKVIKTALDGKEPLHNTTTVSGATPTITGVENTRYICGECSTLTITAPASGCIDVVFESGSTPTVLTVSSAKTGVTAIKWANGFDPTALEANTTYEINILDGEFGVVGSWT